MPPQIADWTGHPFAKADARPDRDTWEYQAIEALITAQVEGLPLSFRVPFHTATTKP
jgi:hypothetical protein